MGTTKPLLQFEWGVPVEGFRWHKRLSVTEGEALEKKGIAVGVAAVPTAPPFLFPESDEVRITRPLEEEPLLFKKFAFLEETPKGILAFANEHGSIVYQ